MPKEGNFKTASLFRAFWNIHAHSTRDVSTQGARCYRSSAVLCGEDSRISDYQASFRTHPCAHGPDCLDASDAFLGATWGNLPSEGDRKGLRLFLYMHVAWLSLQPEPPAPTPAEQCAGFQGRWMSLKRRWSMRRKPYASMSTM